MDKLLNLFNILIFKLYTIHPVTFKRRWTTMKCFVNYWMVCQLFLLRNDWQYISRIWRNFRNVTIWNRSGEVSEWDHDLLSETAPLFEWMWPWKSSSRPAGAWDNSLRTHTWRRTAEIFAIELGQVWGHGYCQHRLWARGLELGGKKETERYVCVSLAEAEKGEFLMSKQLQMHKYPQRGEVNLSYFPRNSTSWLHPYSIVAKYFNS